ncbi:MAG: hypothetical protein DRI93_05895 [Aquificota bacterium]|nr:MAG: hypothetical protein DRI93_05895 [Aquificota bacterium]
MRRKSGLWVGVLLAFFLSSGVVWAGNVDTYGIGAKATALGGAFTARADDFSAAYYNPAGLAQIERPQVSLGAAFVDAAVSAEVDYKNDYDYRDGKYVKDDTHLLVYPHGGVVYPFKLFGKKATFAVATYVPYGLWLRWEPDPNVNAAAYNTYESWYYRVVNAAPTLAIQLTDKLYVGFGLTFGSSHSGVKRRIYQSPRTLATATGFQLLSGIIGNPTLAAVSIVATNGTVTNPTTLQTILLNNANNPAFLEALIKVQASPLVANLKDGKMKTSAVDDFNWSWNVGLIYKIRDNLQIGLCYRGLTKTRFWVRTHIYDGEGNRVDSVKGHTWVDHPDQLQVGIYWRPFKKLHLEFDVTWTNWQRIDHYKVEWNHPLLYDYFYEGLVKEGVDPKLAREFARNAIGDKEDFKRHWRNTVQYRVGVEYELFDWLALRAGYYYDPTPIPEETADATWPDTDKRTFALGTGLKLFGGKLIVDTTYQFTMTDGRRIIGWGDSINLDEAYGSEDEHPEAKMVGRGYVHNITVTLTYVF